jgi:aminoglycoside phosphotransferase (APT) family kinase protein
VTSVGWLADGTEASLRGGLAIAAPELADLPMTINPRHAAADPLWWSSSAVLDGRFVVKFAWSELRATRLWREGVVLARLATREPPLPVPEVVALSRWPALVVTQLVPGVPLSWEWLAASPASKMTLVAEQLAQFLGQLHNCDIVEVLGDLPVVEPTPQADTGSLRDRFGRLVDQRRGKLVLTWCDWVDDALCVGHPTLPGVVVHGDLHGHNQVWDRRSPTLLAVLDFEESGVADPHYDLRYLPSIAENLDLTFAVIKAYELVCGRRLAIERVMAWHVLTALGDALWRTEGGVALPGGGTAATYVDELSIRFKTLELP